MFSIQRIAINLLETKSKGDIILVNNVKYQYNGIYTFSKQFSMKKKTQPFIQLHQHVKQNLADVGCVVVWQ